MLGTILIVILVSGASWSAAAMVAQPELGLYPDRRSWADPSHRCRSVCVLGRI